MTFLLVLAASVIVVVLAHLVVGWRVASGLHRDALEVGPKRRDLGVRVRAVEGSLIVLEAPTPRQDIGHPGVIGVSWPDGYGRVGEVVTAGGGLVTREWAPVRGDPPVCFGDLGTCPPVEMDSYAYPDGPGDVGLDHSEVTYESPLGAMTAWSIPGGDGDRWAVLCHGWTAERRELVRMLPAFHAAGFSSFVIGYRNDPGLPLDPSGRYRFGLTEWEDLQEAVRHVTGAAGTLVLMGCSTGAALVMRFLELSDQADRVDGVVLDAPNIVLADTFRHATQVRVPPLMFEFGMWLADIRWGVDWETTNFVGRADQILRVPTLVFHGTSDATVPVAESRQLAARVPGLVDLVEVPAAGHVMSWNANPESYERRLTEFLSRL